MKEEKEKIDFLLEENVEEQLAPVDWNRLNAAISSRLDKAGQSKTSVWKYQRMFKITAAVSAAAVVFIAVMVRIKKPAEMVLQNGRHAVVKFVETKGSASVEIISTSGRSDVTVGFGGSERKVARCDIEIIDLNGDLRRERGQAAWIIISRPEPLLADNGLNKDLISMICLF